MLVRDDRVFLLDTNLMLLAVSGGKRTRELQIGVYEVGHFGCFPFPISGYKDSLWNTSGVADNVDQILQYHRDMLEDPERRCIILVTHIRKAEQERDGGWRWRKWGPYIGTQRRQAEYLYDEPEIEEVLFYQIHEQTGENKKIMSEQDRRFLHEIRAHVYRCSQCDSLDMCDKAKVIVNKYRPGGVEIVIIRHPQKSREECESL